MITEITTLYNHKAEEHHSTYLAVGYEQEPECAQAHQNRTAGGLKVLHFEIIFCFSQLIVVI